MLFFFASLLLFTNCGSDQVNYKRLLTFNDDGTINAVIEIPAGTNQKIEYDRRKNAFTQEKVNGKPREISFLPYPGNYGYIPDTRLSVDDGGDGDPLDILVLSESRVTGTAIKVKPIGVLLMKDNGELDHKVIAIPADPANQVIRVKDFMDFMINFDAAKQIVETWFLNYKGYGAMELIRWEDEQFAIRMIKRASK